MSETRVFSEADVRAILDRLLMAADLASHDELEWLRPLATRALAEHKSELTEEVVARSHADRLVALALTHSGTWDSQVGEVVPQAAWDVLFEREFIAGGRDHTGEGFVTLTTPGLEFLKAELGRGR